MIDMFVEKNRKWLNFYYWAARVGGWLFLGMSLLAIGGHSVALASRLGDRDAFWQYYHHSMPWGMLSNLLPTGVLGLGVAQLIRYMLEPEYQPGLILRNAHNLVYLYAGYVAVQSGYNLWIGGGGDAVYISVLFTFAWVLILIGLGQTIKRMMPIIEETRTLV